MPKSLISRFVRNDTVVEIHKTPDPLICMVKRFFHGDERLAVEKHMVDVCMLCHKLAGEGWSKEFPNA